MIILASGFVLIFVFILTLVFGVIRIINAAPHRVVTVTNAPTVVQIADDSLNADASTVANRLISTTDKYALAEDVTKLIIELVFILFAILATFVLHSYVKARYAALSTTEPKPT